MTKSFTRLVQLIYLMFCFIPIELLLWRYWLTTSALKRSLIWVGSSSIIKLPFLWIVLSSPIVFNLYLRFFWIFLASLYFFTSCCGCYGIGWGLIGILKFLRRWEWGCSMPYAGRWSSALKETRLDVGWRYFLRWILKKWGPCPAKDFYYYSWSLRRDISVNIC